MTNACPLESGLMSRNARLCSVSRILWHGMAPLMILQKRQSTAEDICEIVAFEFFFDFEFNKRDLLDQISH